MCSTKEVRFFSVSDRATLGRFECGNTCTLFKSVHDFYFQDMNYAVKEP